MRYISAVALIVVTIWAQSAGAGQICELELNDGSVISGELLSLSGGVYTIKSNSLGTVHIDEAKIRSIRTRNQTSSGPASAGAGTVQTDNLTTRMMSDKDIMAMIQALQDDPDFQKVLADPEIMQAVKNNDIPTLMSKPEFMKLLDKPSVHSIQEKMK